MHATRPAAIWRWIALVVGAALLVVGAVVFLGQPQPARSDGATVANSAVATAFELDPGVSVLEGDTAGMSGVVGDGATVGQMVWFQWRPNAADTASPAGAAYIAYDSGDRVPAAVHLYRGPADATGADLTDPIVASAGDAATGGYEFLLPSLAVDEVFYVGVETSVPGAFLMTVWQPTPGGPANDHLVSAASLELAVNANLDTSGFTLAEGTTAGASFETDDFAEPPVSEPHSAPGVGSVWYSWTVPQDGGQVVVTVAAGAATLHVYQRPAGAMSGGVVEGLGTTLDELPADAGSGSDASAGDEVGQFDPTVLVPREDLASGGGVTLTGAAGEVLLMQVVGDGDFTLEGAVSGIVPPDLAAPVSTCTSAVPSGGTDWARTWAGDVETPVTITCFVEDDHGLDHVVAPGDPVDPELAWYTPISATEAEVVLTATAPAGTASDAVHPDLRLVCDLAANCTQVGVGAAVQIDNAPPTLVCDPAPTAWVHGEDSVPADGRASVSIACEASDSASGLAVSADAGFALTASLEITDPSERSAVAYSTHADVCDVVGNCVEVPVPAPAMIDRKAPTVACGPMPDSGSGWFRDNATVECTAADAGSGLASEAQSTITITTNVAPGAVDAAAASAVAKVCDAVGNCADLPQLTGIRVDRAAPVITCDSPGAWTRGTSLGLDCTAVDQADGSGLADPGSDSSFTVPLTIKAGSETSGLAPAPREICDVAGNCAALPALAGVGLDDLPPVVTCAAAPTGWLSGDATVACTAADGGSGLADPAHAAFDLSTAFTGGTSDSVAFVVAPAEVCDVVGNCSPVPSPATVRIDRVEPVVTCVKPVDGAYDFNVTISCTASDRDSGLATGETLDFVLRTSVAPGTGVTGAQTNSREVCDLAGNCVTFGPYGSYDIDLTAPPAAAAPTIVSPAAVNVIAAVPLASFAGIPVPFTAPTVSSEIGAALDCAPDGSGLYPMGDTEVTCTARDAADRVVTSVFPVRVAVEPSLAATTSVPLDRPIPVAGTGFVGPVGVEVAGIGIATLTPVGGAVSGEVALPAGTTTGNRTIVLRGTGADGDPLLIVKPVTITGPAGEAGGSDPATPGTPGTPGGPGGPAGADGDAAGSAFGAAGGPGSPLERALDAERGFVLDPERWPTEDFEDGGDIRVDESAAAAPGSPSPWAPWWIFALGAGLLILASAGAAFFVQRRRAG